MKHLLKLCLIALVLLSIQTSHIEPIKKESHNKKHYASNGFRIHPRCNYALNPNIPLPIFNDHNKYINKLETDNEWKGLYFLNDEVINT